MHELITSGWMMHYLTRSVVTLALMGAVAWLGDRCCDGLGRRHSTVCGLQRC